METKVCARCKQDLPIFAFNARKHHSGNMGYDAWCKSCRSLYKKQYNKEHAEDKKTYSIKYNKTHLRIYNPEYSKKQYNKHINRIRAYQHKTRPQQNARKRQRYKEDPNFKLKTILRRSLHKAVKGIEYKNRTTKLLGCSVSAFKQHLEALFLPGMTWNNWKLFGWHIDHIKPISSFDLTDSEQQKICFHYTNMQPLWWKDNLTKGNKI
jgi:hypothetical protein